MSNELTKEQLAALGQKPEPFKVPKGMFIHTTPKPDTCDHDFQGGVDLRDDEGRVCGFTTVCTKCGMDAMSYSLRTGI
jgi:hypothetical protein